MKEFLCKFIKSSLLRSCTKSYKKKRPLDSHMSNSKASAPNVITLELKAYYNSYDFFREVIKKN